MKKMVRGLLILVVFVYVGMIETVIANAAISSEQFNQRISACKSQYPNYSTWTDAYYYNGTRIGIQCYGWAMLIGEKVFGSCPADWATSRDAGSLKKGDIIRWEGDGPGHSVFVTNVSGNTITFADCNGNGGYGGKCGILWDQTIGKYDVMWPGSRNYRYSYHWVSPGVTNNPDWDNPDKHSVPTRDLYYTSPAMTGDDVTWVQCVLNKLGISCSIDGSYGPGTKSAVASFQSKNGLSSDGSCGPATRAKLKERWDATKQPNGSEMSSGQERLLPDGDYLIASAADPRYYLDIPGSTHPAVSGTNVIISGPLNRVSDAPSWDVWTVKYSGGFYSIKQKGTNIGLDVTNASTARGANVQVHTANTTSAQKWVISHNGTQGYRIQAKCSGYSLDITNAAFSNGTNIQQWTSSGTKAQAWVFIPWKPAQPVAEGRYVLISSLANNKELDLEDNSGNVSSGTNARLWNDSVKSQYNSFDVKKLSNGYYQFINTASGLSLNINEASTAFRGNVNVSDKNGTAAQQWAITPSHVEGSYLIRARCSGYCMEVQGYTETKDGANIQQWPYGGSQYKNQSWRLVPAEYTVTYNANQGTGAPANQTKYYKTALTLTSSKPTRSGYSFLGWSENRSAVKATYSAGDTYTGDADITMYAVWAKINNAGSENTPSGGGSSIGESTKPGGGGKTGGSTKPGGGSKTGGSVKPGSGSQTGGNAQPGSGSQADRNTKPRNDGQQSKAEQTLKEPIKISKSPASVKAKAKKAKVVVSWKKIKKTRKNKKLLAQIKRIQVQYSTDSKFKKNVKTKEVGKKKTKVKLKLKKKTIYYFRVRYVGKDGVSRWSKVKQVKTKK